MKNIRGFLTENFHFLVVKFSVCLNRHVFVMTSIHTMCHAITVLLNTIVIQMSYLCLFIRYFVFVSNKNKLKLFRASSCIHSKFQTVLLILEVLF